MKRVNDFAVGAAVLVGAVALIAGTLWVKQADIGDRTVHLDARFRQVGNAQVGNAVVIRGVRAGRIVGMELLADGWVRVRFALDPAVTLPATPAALLNESSLFGEWQATILERSALPADREVRQEIEEADRSGAEIPGATLPDIAQLTAVAGRIAGDVASVAGRVEVAFDDSAARELRTSIRSVAELSTTLAEAVRRHSRSLDVVVTDVNRGVGSLTRAADAARRVAERAEASTAGGKLEAMTEDAGHAAAQLRAAADELRALSGRVAATQGKLDVVLARTDSVVTKLDDGRGTLGLMVNDPSLYRNTDSLVAQLRELVGDVRRNPRRYISIRLF